MASLKTLVNGAQAVLAGLERLLGSFAVRDVDESHDRADNRPSGPLWKRPVLGGKAGSVGPPKNLVVDMNTYPCSDRLIDAAFVDGKGRSVGMAVMDQPVHVLSQQIVLGLVSQQTYAGRIAERAIAVQVDSIDSLGGGIEQQPQLFLFLLQQLVGLLAFGHLLLQHFVCVAYFGRSFLDQPLKVLLISPQFGCSIAHCAIEKRVLRVDCPQI